jgi:D-glycero-alpha-D-manno-heptose-7-phosphate kinase
MRLSFFGGGTDIQDYYKQHSGVVLSTAIKKYTYVALNKKFDNKIKVSYSELEEVDSLDKMRNPIVKAALKKLGITKGVEIATFADIPTKGTGLGGSSSFTVGLLNALYTFKGIKKSQAELSADACDIEINHAKTTNGKQDQYGSAIGGFKIIKFNKDDSVEITPIKLTKKRAEILQSRLIQFYTGGTRGAMEILTKQAKEIPDKVAIYEKMKEQVYEGAKLLDAGKFDEFGKMLDQAWEYKRQLSGGISNPAVDDYYRRAINAGALGGKLSGAGGAGFLVFYCPEGTKDKVRAALADIREMPVEFDFEGAKVIYGV